MKIQFPFRRFGNRIYHGPFNALKFLFSQYGKSKRVPQNKEQLVEKIEEEKQSESEEEDKEEKRPVKDNDPVDMLLHPQDEHLSLW